MAVKVLLNILVDGESTTCNELVEGEWVFRVVNLALQHWIEVLEVDICVFNQGLSCLTHKYNFHTMVEFMKQDVDDLENEVGLHWHQNFSIEIRLEALDHLVKKA